MFSHEEIIERLKERDPARLAALWEQADRVRMASVGDEVHLRGLIEISNHCVRSCAYCGLATWEKGLSRYRMTADEILAAASRAVEYGYGTVVLQSGEDYAVRADWMAEVVRQIKTQTSLAVTLSLGERSNEELSMWREAGADRYLLRFETSDRKLYDTIHPPLNGRTSDRFEILKQLRDLGYEVGSGVMVGIPGQTFNTLAEDILRFVELDLDMIGIGPYIACAGSPLATGEAKVPDAGFEQVPNDEMTAYKVVALTRILCPKTNIPSTSALATLNKSEGRELGLMRGANVIMPNVTPLKYRTLYRIYPDKACVLEDPADYHIRLTQRIQELGRRVGLGPGASRNYAARSAAAAAN